MVRSPILKKKKGIFQSYKTFYISFGVSLLLHVAVIFFIPTTILYSEGFGKPASEDMILVDLLEAEPAVSVVPEEAPELSPQEPPPPVEPTEPEETTEQVEIEMPPPAPLEISDGITLITPSEIPEPEWTPLQKRSLEPQDMLVNKPLLEPKRQEKMTLPVSETSPMTQLRPPSEVSKATALPPLPDRELQQPKQPEEKAFAPVLQQPAERQIASSEYTPEQRIVFGKRPEKQITRETTFSPSSFESFSEKRRVGVTRKDETDHNRFGIFAGKTVEEPPMKETVQEVAIEPQKAQEPTLQENMEVAQQLKVSSEIEGPVKGRKIVYQPPLPEVDVEIDVEFRLKFWVLPDGTIGEVIPLKRGDARLERIAISYLKKWQFEPLASNVPQTNIWGTIPIRFSVQ